MTARQLQSWRERHDHSIATGAETLGIGKATFSALLAGERAIPPTIALLCAALDELKRKRTGTKGAA